MPGKKTTNLLKYDRDYQRYDDLPNEQWWVIGKDFDERIAGAIG